MEPVSVGIIACRVFFRLWAQSAYEEAALDQRSARETYQNSYRRAVEEQQVCIAGCHALGENRKAVLDGRWSHLHTLLVACGINGGLFAPPRQVFGKQSEEDVRSILSSAEKLVVSNTASSMKAMNAITTAVVLVQGVRCLDAGGTIHLTALHKSLHDALGSLGGQTGADIADAMGSFATIPMDTLVGGALAALGTGISLAIFALADECGENAARLRQAAQELDDKWATLAAANRRIHHLLAELDVASYELLKWTVVSEEAARLQRAARGRKRNVSDLPRWMLHGLLRKATQLWASCNKPVFG